MATARRRARPATRKTPSRPSRRGPVRRNPAEGGLWGARSPIQIVDGDRGAKIGVVMTVGPGVFEGTDFSGGGYRVEWGNQNFSQGRIVRARMGDLSFARSTFYQATIAHSDLRGATFDRAEMMQANILHCHIGGASFRGADLTRTEWKDCDGEINVDRANASNASFTNCRLDGSYFEGADLRAAKFWNCHLRDVHFEGAMLGRASFELCNLTGSYRSPKDAPVRGWIVRGGRMVPKPGSPEEAAYGSGPARNPARSRRPARAKTRPRAKARARR